MNLKLITAPHERRILHSMSEKQMKEMIEFMDEKGLSDKEILDCFRRMCGANPSPSDSNNEAAKAE